MAPPKGSKNALGNKGGRPSVLERNDITADDLAGMMLDYFQEHLENLLVLSTSTADSKKGKLVNGILLRFPFFSRFARDTMNMSEDVLLVYAKDSVMFQGAYKRCKNIQKECLIQLGLAGISPPAAFIFVSKNLTDMRDEMVLPPGDGKLMITWQGTTPKQLPEPDNS